MKKKLKETKYFSSFYAMINNRGFDHPGLYFRLH
jgi:hypothetical protein